MYTHEPPIMLSFYTSRGKYNLLISTIWYWNRLYYNSRSQCPPGL